MFDVTLNKILKIPYTINSREKENYKTESNIYFNNILLFKKNQSIPLFKKIRLTKEDLQENLHFQPNDILLYSDVIDFIINDNNQIDLIFEIKLKNKKT